MQGACCFHCGYQFPTMTHTVGRRDTCDRCGSDMHVCRNCVFYDLSSYNECKEPQAERVLEKDRANFCDYFKIGDAKSAQKKGESKEDVLKKLDNLFK